MDKKTYNNPSEEIEEDDEELLKEFEWAENHIPDSVVPKPDPDAFEKIWRRIQEEREQ
ncbi:hypothetical protein [Enterocloster citroniae]|uniref:hypothetical protein n=1 Tax=Enterocloster citroniae TaxID=358743 RepID=UPI002E797B04|nr:hypothetical protein [Enterocloster citroniae]MBS1482311.1 hypothetical protein [Clostridium sp.]